MPFEEIEDFGIVIVICCVWEKETPNDQYISNTQTIWQLLAGDGKSISALKIYIWWDMSYSISYVVPTQF